MIFPLRQWWSRYAVRVGYVALAIAVAWGLRETKGALIYEVYRWLSSPFQPGASRQEIQVDSYTQGLQQRLVELEVQNRNLRAMVGTESATPDEAILAAVIGRSAGDWWQQVIISRGSRDGIREGYIVTSPGGVVGRVIAVSPSSSRVLLISDTTSRVGARISRSRATGYVRGQTGQQVIMEFFDKMPEVEVGDVVMTSAYSQLFPAGMPIGRVVELNLNNSPAPEVTIELSAPIGILEWVQVIPFETPETLEIPEVPQDEAGNWSDGVEEEVDNPDVTSPALEDTP